jgi:hypothetical protein
MGCGPCSSAKINNPSEKGQKMLAQNFSHNSNKKEMKEGVDFSAHNDSIETPLKKPSVKILFE